jgi:hypothetical protein
MSRPTMIHRARSLFSHAAAALRAGPLAMLVAVLIIGRAAAFESLVTDSATGRPVAGAIVTAGGHVVMSDAEGRFMLPDLPAAVAVRAAGYRRMATAPRILAGTGGLHLTPFDARALYLSSYGATSEALRTGALRTMAAAGMNAVVIDVKSDRGLVPRDSASVIAQNIGSNRTSPIRDLPGLVSAFKARGLYTIARIVVFKDDVLASRRPDLAVHDRAGRLWRDRESLHWTDPFRSEVWDYNIDIAREAAAAGFDEVQFDYIRFPDATGLVYSGAWDQASRIGAIAGFLKLARERLAPYNVFLSADLFGYACWNTNDTLIGQRIEELAPLLDYTSPMLYPSGFQLGIPGHRNPVAAPYAIVFESLARAMERTGLPAKRFRPWLQAFRDYAFGGGEFEAGKIGAQIQAAKDFGSSGYMFWNPRNVYDVEDFVGAAPERPSR